MIRAFGWALSFLCVALPAAAAQDAMASSLPPTALESMLAGHVCGQPKSQDAADQDARERCTQEQRLALRAEFGYDLGRLSVTERRKLDATCSRFRRNYDVEPYLTCVTQGLVSLRAQWTPATSDQPSFGSPTIAASAAPPPPPTLHWYSAIIVLPVGTVLAIALSAVALRKTWRRSARLCRDCSAVMDTASDLCPTCRHRAAAALKQATADRAEQERAAKEALRLQQEEAEERQRQLAEQEVRLRQDEEARQAERARRAAEAPPPPAAAVTWSPPVEDAPPVFDPYKILSVSSAASHEEVEAAYREARSRYDSDLVAHLGEEVQMHFKMKAEAVEEAYRTLIQQIPA